MDEKVALVVGGGQTEGETVGNGRAMAMLFAREGARVVVADRERSRAEATVAAITDEYGTAITVEADVTRGEDCRAMVSSAVDAFGRIDVLVNNVGIGAGDGGPTHVEEEAWDLIHATNLKSMVLTCKHVLPVMRVREQRSGAIVNISSIAAVCSMPLLAYKTSKAGVNALTQSLANANAKHGIRANAVMPGLVDTPMAVDALARATGVDRTEVAARRDALVPLRGGQGSAWDVAHAALYLASDEAGFVTGAVLPVDGGQSARVG